MINWFITHIKRRILELKKMKLEFFGVQTPIINSSDKDITNILLEAIKTSKIELQDKDIIIIASKVISIIEGCQLPLNSITHVQREAEVAAKIAGLDPRFVEVVFQEADEIFGAVPGAILALRNNIIQANAGVDQSNAGGDEFLIVLPRDPFRSAEKIRKTLYAKIGQNFGIILADSKTHPLRQGTSGFALAVSGFIPLIDDRGTEDLYGRHMKITTRAIADNLVSGAEILMGETNQRVPVVVVRGCNVITFQEEEDIEKNNDLMKISPQNCIYMGPLWYSERKD